VPHCCSEKFLILVLLRFKQCAPSEFIASSTRNKVSFLDTPQAPSNREQLPY
jgi:hypothetical protein